jgi:hypothetical protein
MKADEIAALRDSEPPSAACLESKSSNNQDMGICQCISTEREAEVVTVPINTPKCGPGVPDAVCRLNEASKRFWARLDP